MGEATRSAAAMDTWKLKWVKAPCVRSGAAVAPTAMTIGGSWGWRAGGLGGSWGWRAGEGISPPGQSCAASESFSSKQANRRCDSHGVKESSSWHACRMEGGMEAQARATNGYM